MTDTAQALAESQTSEDLQDIPSDAVIDVDGPLVDIEPESTQNSPTAKGLAVVQSSKPEITVAPPPRLFQRPTSSGDMIQQHDGFAFSAAPLKPQAFTTRPLQPQSEPMLSGPSDANHLAKELSSGDDAGHGR